MEEVLLVVKYGGAFLASVVCLYIVVRVVSLAVLRSARDVKKERS